MFFISISFILWTVSFIVLNISSLVYGALWTKSSKFILSSSVTLLACSTFNCKVPCQLFTVPLILNTVLLFNSSCSGLISHTLPNISPVLSLKTKSKYFFPPELVVFKVTDFKRKKPSTLSPLTNSPIFFTGISISLSFLSILISILIIAYYYFL